MAFLLIGVLGSTAASATQTDDPYGSTSTTAPPGNDPACSIAQSEARIGGTVSGTVTGVPVGATLEFFLGGVKLGEAQADGGPSGARAFGSSTTTVEFSFTIPATLVPGTYELVVVGSTFNRTCVNPDGGTDFTVLAADDATGDGDGGGGGGLAFTGANILWLVILGLVLLAVGYELRRRTRQAKA